MTLKRINERIQTSYDEELSKLTHVSELLRYGKFTVVKDRNGRLFHLHNNYENNLLNNIFPYGKDKSLFNGKRYIRKPNFMVQTQLYNPTNLDELNNPVSIESALFITQLSEYGTFIDYHRIDRDIILQMISKLIPILEYSNPVEQFYAFLDKDLIRIAIRIRKIMIGPGQFLLKEEFVPIIMAIHYEIFENLIQEYGYINLDDNGLKWLQDKAIIIASNLYTEDSYNLNLLCRKIMHFKLEGLDIQYDNPFEIVRDFFSTKSIHYINDWNMYQEDLCRRYGIKLNDNLIFQGTEVNGWNHIDDLYYDNRKDYTIAEQAKIFKKII